MKRFFPTLPLSACRIARLMALTVGIAFVATPMAIASTRIIQAEGGVMIKRRGWSEFRPAEVGSVLHPGDLVQPTRGATVVVLCENSNRWRVPAGVPSGVSNGCPAQRSMGLASSLRGDLNSDRLGALTSQVESQIPYIISPRRSWVLDPQPRFRWNPVADATQYTVRVIGPDVDWRTQTTEPYATYQGESPLQPSETYLVVVQADTGASSQQELMGDLWMQLQNDEPDLAFVVDETLDGASINGLGFSVLPPEESEILAQERDHILAQRLSAEAQALSLADLYIRHRLIADAIEVLTPLAQDPSSSAAVTQTLGSLYHHVGLVRESEQAYQQAIARSSQADDVEAQMAAQLALAELYAQTNRPELAQDSLNAILPIYEPMEPSQRKLEFARTVGEVYARLGQQAIADQWLNQALTGYQALLELAQSRPTTSNTTELDALKQQVAEIEYLLSTLQAS